VVLVLLTAACSTLKPKTVFLTQQEWEDALRRNGVDPSRVPNPLAVSDSMRETAKELAGVGTHQLRLARLQAQFFAESAFPFRYDNRETLTAAEAFHRREGNCLSFTNLFVAMGRTLGAPVTTALVKRSRASEKEGDLIVVNNHVVAALDTNASPSGFVPRLVRADAGWAVYDFDRRRHERPGEFIPLDDLWITALYLNNRGADELRATHPDIAIRYFEDALKLAPEFAACWGNVGVARRRLGDIPGALHSYQRALEIEPDNPTILSNLASLFRALGRRQESDNALAAANLTLASPHVLLVRGDLALTQGNVGEALKLYKRAHKAGPTLVDPFLAMARAELARKRPDAARAYVAKALERDANNADARQLEQELAGHSPASAGKPTT
jgi:tetratricopeptide (TPR) repeat protein